MLSFARPTRTGLAVGTFTAIGAAVILAYLFVLAWAMDNVSYDIWGAMVVGPILLAAGVAFLTRAGADPDRRVRHLLVLAFVTKMLGTLVRYAVTFEVYGGRADAGGYHGSGARLAASFWNGTWDRVLPQEVPELFGSEFMRLATGIVYVVTGPTKLGGFLVYSFLGFWGLYGFYRAFRIAFPEGDHRRYAIAVFFLPSMLYWPSSIGKEAWMLFTLGIAAYGVALVLTYRAHGYLVLAVGLAGTAAVRPHVTLLVFIALFVAHLLRRRSWRASRLGLLGRIAGLVLLVGLGAIVLTQAANFFHVDEIDPASVEQVLDRTADQSSKGGSEFDAASRLTSPAEYPYATVSVLFRPFPWEAGNTQALVAAAEGTVLMLLFALSLPRLWRLPRYLFTTPYVAFATAYTAMFCLAFSAIGNFGILTRQRTQVLPLVLVLIAIPRKPRAVADVATSEHVTADSVVV